MKSINASPTHFNSTVQNKKIFCAFHPTQFLTNFCLQQQCLMPLCPSCVVEHTQQHYQAKQKPTYINLNQALHQVKQKCYSDIHTLEQFHQINVHIQIIILYENNKQQQIFNYIDGLRSYIRKQLIICKTTVIDHVNVLFEEYQEILFKGIMERYQKDNVYDIQECKEVKTNVLENIQSLYEKVALLKGEQCLSALIRFYGEDQEIIDQNIEVMKEHLEKNKKAGGIHVGLNEEVLVEIFKDLCAKVISLKTIHEDDLQVDDNIIKQKKPITILSRLKSPFDTRKVKKQNYHSPLKEKPFKQEKDFRYNKY